MITRPSFVLVALLTACGSEPAAPHAPEAPAKGPAATPAAPSREAAPASAPLMMTGTISYDGPATGAKLFVSIKDPAKPGPPLAAKQLPPGPFPMTFTLTEADLMQMGGAPRAIPATVALTVRLDADGDAMTKAPTEPVAMMETAASTTGLAVTLSVPK